MISLVEIQSNCRWPTGSEPALFRQLPCPGFLSRAGGQGQEQTWKHQRKRRQSGGELPQAPRELRTQASPRKGLFNLVHAGAEMVLTFYSSAWFKAHPDLDPLTSSPSVVSPRVPLGDLTARPQTASFPYLRDLAHTAPHPLPCLYQEALASPPALRLDIPSSQQVFIGCVLFSGLPGAFLSLREAGINRTDRIPPS